mmetsp:Transcript_52214/g.154110  ORF Transcript_52214/g.154110 Transcript_52214/m.154110 type:complete len:409 (-) Transcript_52214:49-1275(-)
MLPNQLCRCICGSTGKGDDAFDPTRVLGSELDFPGEEDLKIQNPDIQGYMSYSASTDQPLRGVPIREGDLWLLSAEEEVALISLSLYVNGFAFSHKDQEHSFSLSPFALVRNCKFQATTSEGVNLSDFKCFKVSLFTQGACFYFGVRSLSGDDREAEEERSRWVIDISRAMRLVTQSLFPQFNIVCEPLQAILSTRRRLMAGYLLHHDDMLTASVLYCELHPQENDHGKLVVYENERCEALLLEILITERTTCCEKVGISCSCFSVEEHLFSTRTLAERKLWLRAISNVKVKLQHRAPAPTDEELSQYRTAIREHVKHAGGSGFHSQASMDALLHRFPPRSVNGGGLERHGESPPRPPTIEECAAAAAVVLVGGGGAEGSQDAKSEGLSEAVPLEKPQEVDATSTTSS